MGFFKELFANLTVRRFSILLLLCVLLFSIKDMLNLILFTFLVTYIMNRLENYITRKLNKVMRINYRVVVIVLYLLLAFGIVVGITNSLSILITQVRQMSNQLIDLYNSFQGFQGDGWTKEVGNALNGLDFQSYAKKGLDYIYKIGGWGTTIFFALLLSLFFLLEKSKIMQFTNKFKTSKIAFFYNEIEYFSRKFVFSFGKVIESQILISIINTLLTALGLWILGFPYLFALSIMTFILCLVPVVGMIVSLIPLCMIGLSIGGLPMVAYVVIMVLAIHFVESYILYPRMMSSKSSLPMFYTFIILIFSEHYLGVWGLIIGIPIIVFLLDIIEVEKVENIA